MSKTMHESHIGGENLGILRLGERTLHDAAAVARDIITAGGRQAWLASAITELAQDHPIACVDVAPSPWVEIDFPEDLVRARTEVLPALADVLPELAELAEPMLAAGAR
jgi:choline kinase